MHIRAQWIALLGTLIVLGLGYWQATAISALTQAAQPGNVPPVDEVEALAFIEAITAPQDCLITDDMPLAYWSNRPVPPELAEVSSNRLVSGVLTTEQLVSLTDRYDCQVVAAVANRIPKHLPDYMDWVKGEYLGMFHYAEDDIFFAKRHTDPMPASPLWAKFGASSGDKIIFHGSTLSAAAVKPGGRIALTLVWQAQTAIQTDYSIFVQVRNAAGATVISADHSPYLGLLPTSRWPAGAVVQETTWLDVPADLPPDHYPIYIGLYRPDTLERLPLLDDTSGEHALIMGPLVVE
ncbi:MAG: hypothetical protein R3264_03360 [Anaerolineae bacterium]|nr:hypothetical protein [Anaerolineae bacterium]